MSDDRHPSGDIARKYQELLALVAHELRQPLQASLAAVRQMELDPDSSSREHARAVVHRQLEQMNRLVEDLVDAERIVYGHIELSLGEVDLTALIATVTEAVDALMRERQVHFTVSLPPHPIRLRADASRLQQVLMNLLVNAAKYSDPAGTVELSAQTTPDAVTITVSDDGHGIEPAMLPRIFDLFTRGVQGGSGFGVGLAVARRLVELHGGRIDARSPGVERGSEFVVTLPAHAD